jgi:hypothetical protein
MSSLDIEGAAGKIRGEDRGRRLTRSSSDLDVRSGIKLLADTPGTGAEIGRQRIYLMRIGGTRRLRISPHLAYGKRGVPGVIPADAVLDVEIHVLEERVFENLR